MKTLLGLCLILIVPLNAGAQKLDRLRERAGAFWALRVAGNSVEFSKFASAAARNALLQAKDPHFLHAEISAIEFAGNANLATVVARVRIATLELGEVQRDMRDVWMWNGQDWFVQPQLDQRSPFASQLLPGGAPAAPPLEFKFTDAAIQLGSHVQGEVISGKVEFTSDRSRISLILPADSSDLLFAPVEWKDQQTASMTFTFDTTLLVGDVVRVLKFRVMDQTGREISRTLQFQAEIQGRVRFTQVPDPLDTTKDGVVEVLIQNLASEPIRIVSIRGSNNEDFRLSEGLKLELNPGEVSTIKATYRAQREPTGTSLQISFSRPILGKSTVVFPLRTRQLPSGPAQYSPEQLQELIRQTPPRVPR